MSVEQIIAAREIREILHFTTQFGLTGILHHRLVKSRNLLPEDKSLQYILKLNTTRNMDPAWKSYVNLSISRINSELFGHSKRWHPDVKWRVLAFDPIILTHADVHFVTTNNAYFMHLERGTGPDALEKLFQPRVNGVYGSQAQRTPDMHASWTTDVQAEVLYPTQLSTDYLRRIIVPTQADAETVAGKIASLGHPAVSIDIDPEAFR